MDGPAKGGLRRAGGKLTADSGLAGDSRAAGAVDATP